MMNIVEDQPAIDVGALMEWGLLKPGKMARTTARWRRAFGDAILKATMSWDPGGSALQILINLDGNIRQQSVQVERRKGRFRERVYFICPLNGARSEALYFMENTFASRTAHRLVYESQAGNGGKYREFVKWDVVELPPRKKPARDPSFVPGWHRLDIKFGELSHRSRISTENEREWAEIKRERRLAARENDMDTASALRRGKRSTPQISYEWFDREFGRLMSQWSPARPDHPLDPKFDMAIWEDQPRLDIRVLAKEGLIKAGQLRGAILAWKLGSPIEQAHIFVDLRNPEGPYIGLMMIGYEATTYQIIRLLTPSAKRGRRYAMRCPVTYKPVEVMAYREGRFGTRKNQRLINASQRAVGHSAAGFA
jgi:hypothetical protein